MFYFLIPLSFAFFFLLERFLPLRRFQHSFSIRLIVNFGISALLFATSSQLVEPAIQNAFQLDSKFGLLEMLNLPPLLRFVLAWALMDLSFYYWHRLNHIVPFLWRFHVVHHSDPEMDTSTAFRFHFGEVALSSVFRFLQVLLIGMNATEFYSYQVVFVIATVFHHSNLRLPFRFERVLSFFIITPRLHELHHSTVKAENFSNYSVVFSLWDRIHKSFSRMRVNRLPSIGIPFYDKTNDQKFWALLIAPLIKPKSYWKGSDAQPKQPE